MTKHYFETQYGVINVTTAMAAVTAMAEQNFRLSDLRACTGHVGWDAVEKPVSESFTSSIVKLISDGTYEKIKAESDAKKDAQAAAQAVILADAEEYRTAESLLTFNKTEKIHAFLMHGSKEHGFGTIAERVQKAAQIAAQAESFINAIGEYKSELLDLCSAQNSRIDYLWDNSHYASWLKQLAAVQQAATVVATWNMEEKLAEQAAQKAAFEAQATKKAEEAAKIEAAKKAAALKSGFSSRDEKLACEHVFRTLESMQVRFPHKKYSFDMDLVKKAYAETGGNKRKMMAYF